MQCLQFDFDIYTGRQVQAHQGIHSLWSRVHDVDQAFMCTHFELFPRILILVHRTENGNYLFLSWRRDRTGYTSTRTFCCLNNFLSGLIKNSVVVCFQANTNFCFAILFPPSIAQFGIGHTPRKFSNHLPHGKGAGCVGNLSHHRNVAEQHSLLYIKDRRIASTNS